MSSFLVWIEERCILQSMTNDHVMLSEHRMLTVCKHSVSRVFTHPKLTVCGHLLSRVFTHPMLRVCEHLLLRVCQVCRCVRCVRCQVLESVVKKLKNF